MEKIIKRKVKIKDCKKDFGLGEGVIYADEVVLKERSENMLMASLLQSNDDLVDNLIVVEMEDLTKE